MRSPSPFLVLSRAFTELSYRYQWWQERRSLDASLRKQSKDLEKLVRQRNQLRQQMASIAAARRMLAVWHTIHIPLGMVLFTAAFIHIIAALYYATLLH